MKTETDPVLVLDTFAALESNVSTIKQLFNQISFISNVQRAKQKKIQKAPELKTTKLYCLCPKPQLQQIIQFVGTYIISQYNVKRY